MHRRTCTFVASCAISLGLLTSPASGQAPTTVAPAPVPQEARGLFKAEQVPTLQFVDFNARPFTDSYGEGYAATCPPVTQLRTLHADATTTGLGSTFGDANGRTVGRYKIVTFKNPKASREFFEIVHDNPACAGAFAGDVITGVLSQYPVAPAAPTFGTPTVTDNLVTVPFTGTTTIGNFDGEIYIASSGSVTTFTAVRVATPVAGLMASITPVITPVILYDTALAGSPPPTEEMTLGVEEYTRVTQDEFTGFLTSEYPDAAVQPAPRTTVATFPPECANLSEAFTLSGQNAALGGFTAHGAGGKFQARVELFAFSNTKAARDYIDKYADLRGCLTALWPPPAGTQASPIVRRPKTRFSNNANTCGMRLYGAWAPPGATSPALSRAVGVGRWRHYAAFYNMQLADGSVVDIGSTLCKELAANAKKSK